MIEREKPRREPPARATERRSSLVLVNTGEGKGKTTAALGTALRAAGAGWHVLVIQFLKSGKWKTGEEEAGRRLGIDWWSLGDGFTWDSKDMDETEARARAAWTRAKDAIMRGDHQLVVLDEVTYPVTWGWIDEADVVATIGERPEHVSVILTGRDASPGLLEIADTATEMVKRKHVFDAGVKALKGIDF
ncbi:MAG: cob(I)yrinic acid a,c-diamide adenosyltransferase [Actinomycetota bacterium]